MTFIEVVDELFDVDLRDLVIAVKFYVTNRVTGYIFSFKMYLVVLEILWSRIR